MKQKIHAHQIDFPSLLRDAGLKATPGRISLLTLLSKEPKPLTVAAIKKKSSKDTVTLYRALEDFVTAGIVRRIDFAHSHAHYEIVAGRKHHHHVICKKCELVEDIYLCEFGNLEKSVLAETKGFYAITDHALEFFGMCKTCSITK